MTPDAVRKKLIKQLIKAGPVIKLDDYKVNFYSIILSIFGLNLFLIIITHGPRKLPAYLLCLIGFGVFQKCSKLLLKKWYKQEAV